MRGEPGELVLGRYRIEHQIGRGGFGRIFLARQVALARAVALKASAVEQRSDVAIRERFRREAVLVASISHPNVVTYHDFGTDDEGDMILVMEYLRGRSLREAFRPGEPWSITDAAEVVRQVADGLYAAHEAGIVHRDVKPSNLFLTALPTGEWIGARRPASSLEGEMALGHRVGLGGAVIVKVIDFGILRVDAGVRPDLPDLTAPEAVIGTPAYLAPEMLLGRRPDPRADQYSLALVACELLTGRRAFGGPENPDSFLSRVSRRPPELALIPEGPASVLWRALAPDRDERFESVVEFARALVLSAKEDKKAVKTVPNVGTAIEKTHVLEPATRRRRRWFRAWVVWPASIVVTAVVSALWLWRADRQPPDVLTAPGAVVSPFPMAEIRSPSAPVVSDRLDVVAVEQPGPDRVLGPSSRVSRLRPSSQGRVAPGMAPERAEPPGRLTINAKPWADVWLDGISLGRTPVLDYEVRPGSHTVTLKHPTLGTRTVTRTIRSGETVTLTEVFGTSAPHQDSPPEPRKPSP